MLYRPSEIMPRRVGAVVFCDMRYVPADTRVRLLAALRTAGVLPYVCPTDEFPEARDQFGISTAVETLFFADGRLTDRVLGAPSDEIFHGAVRHCRGQIAASPSPPAPAGN